MKPGRDAAAAAALGAGLAALYWAGAASAYGPGDSPQHALAWLTWSVPHPPGYPLNTALGWAWTRAFSPSSLCAVLHGAAAALFGLLFAREFSLGLAGWAAAALLGLSPLYAFYAGVPEVRALNDLLAVAAALFAARWTRAGRAADWRSFAAVCGLGVSHHPTFVLLAPAYAVWLHARVPSRRELALGAALAAAALAAPYLLLGVRLAVAPPVYDLFGVRGPTGLLSLFLRRSLGGGFQTVAGPAAPFDPALALRHLAWFLDSLLSFAGAPLLALAAWGAWRVRGREAAGWALWLIGPALGYACLSARSPAGFDPVYARAVANRFHLLPMIAAYALAARGLAALPSRAALGAAAAAVLLFVAAPLGQALRTKEATRDYLRAVVASSEPGDLIVLAADDAIFAALHLDLAEDAAEGRVFLAPSMFAFPPYIKRLRARHPAVNLPLGPSGLSRDWREWARLNPARAVLAEAVLAPALGPAPARQGVLLRADGRPARALSVEPPSAAGLRAWTQESYLLAVRAALAGPGF